MPSPRSTSQQTTYSTFHPMSDSNLSKTKPAFRTKGAVTGNFGAGRRKGGSALNDIPANSRESLGNFPTRGEYYNRLVEAYHSTTSQRLKEFILEQLRQMDAQRPGDRVDAPPQGAHCSLEDYHVQPYQ